MSSPLRMSGIALAILILLGPAASFAQDPAAAQAPPPAAEDRDFFTSVEQPDFTIVTLPTTLRLPLFRSAFRVTHRFGRPLGAGDFGDLASDLFGLDSGAQIGLEYRFGLLPRTQVGIHRTSDKTIQLFGQYHVLRQDAGTPVGLGVLVSVEGVNNFRDQYTTALGVAISRTLPGVGAVYVEPMWLDNTNPVAPDLLAGEDDDTFLVGVGARIRVWSTVYLAGEIVPRLSGYDPGSSHLTFAIEKRAGGHMFQLNVSNGFGTTLGQVARGGLNNDDWYLGFNIARKFF